MPFGAQLIGSDAVRLRLWAPPHPHVEVEIAGRPERLPMRAQGDGWHECVVRNAGAGLRYRFALPDGATVPDPASRFQPDDIFGASEVVDPSHFVWTDNAWRGRPWDETIIYEIHIGAFTPQGTFRAAIEKLDHLAALGVTALLIMPVSDFPGRRNWGYDGVFPFAPDASYGTPDDFKTLIDAAHTRGLSVFLDVVYNHFGPEGAAVYTLSPQFFSDRHKTPWGLAVNMDGPDSAVVRDFFIHNALYWIEEFHMDGLRLDATHAIFDDSQKHFLHELAQRTRDIGAPRPIHLFIENENNESRWVDPGPPDGYSGHLNDDAHHVLHVAATGESSGYYAAYAADPGALGRALAEGFASQDEPPAKALRGPPSATLPPSRFIAFIQNHDQIGNRAYGERITALAPLEVCRALAAVYLLLPQIPFIFMGEEWGTSQPFPFFCDFGPELTAAVREGRRRQFGHAAAAGPREAPPDATAEACFLNTKLPWEEIGEAPHAEVLGWYRDVIALRKTHIVPLLPTISRGGQQRLLAPGAVVVNWTAENRGTLILAANLSHKPVEGFPTPQGETLLQEGAVDGTTFGPWAVRWTLAAHR